MNFPGAAVLLLLLLFDVFYAPTQSFQLLNKDKKLFKKRNWPHDTLKDAANVQNRAVKLFVHYIGRNKNTIYEKAKVNKMSSTFHPLSRIDELTIDLLLRRTFSASGKAKAYPFDYLICNNVKIIYKDSNEDFNLKNYSCKDLGTIAKGLDKEIVAQAARSYTAIHFKREKYVVLRVLKAETDGVVEENQGEVRATLLLDLEVVKAENLVMDSYSFYDKLEVTRCSNVNLEYRGEPDKWTGKDFVQIKSVGHCKDIHVPLRKTPNFQYLDNKFL